MANRSRTLLLSLVLVLVTGIMGPGLLAQQDRRSEMLEHFKRGVDLYERGRYEEAAVQFDALLRMKPDMAVAMEMRKSVSLAMLIKMQREGKLEKPVQRILDIVTSATRAQLRNTEAIEKVIPDFESPEFEKHAKASYLLTFHGQYAIPCLLPYLAEPEKDRELPKDITTRALLTVYRMNPSACLPLIEVLKSEDPDLRARAAVSLGYLKDPRAIAALQARAEDEGEIESVKDFATEAIRKITDQEPGDVPPAPQCYYNLALDYLHDKGETVGYIYEDVYDIWTWNADAETLKDKLVDVPVPSYLAFLKLAENNCIEGLRIQPDHAELNRLLVNVYYRQLAEVRRLAEMADQPDFGGLDILKSHIEDAKKRLGELSWRVQVVARSAGPELLSAALQFALDEADAPGALLLIAALQDELVPTVGSAGPGTPAGSLINALEFGDKLVRYEAALALLRRGPGAEFGGAEPAMKVMATMLRSAAARNALLVVDDLQTRNKLARELRELGLSTVESSADMGRINNSLLLQPVVDVVFVTANLPGPTFAPVLKNLKADPRTMHAPVFLVLDTERAEKSGSVDPKAQEGIAGVIEAELIVQEYLKKMVLKPLADAPASDAAKAQDAFIKKGLEAIVPIDPLQTGYELAKYLEESVAKVTVGSSEEVKLLAIRALAGFGTKNSVRAVVGVVKAEETEAVRAAALKALGAIHHRAALEPDADTLEAVTAALKDASETVRVAAAEAYGLMNVPADKRLQVIQEVKPSIQ
jgi:HEAT repeat protein